MEKFKFNAHQKCTIWWSNPFEIEAQTKEEAVAKLEELVNLGELEDLFADGGEIIAESIVEQLPSDNEGRPTFAIFDEENTIVYENATLY